MLDWNEKDSRVLTSLQLSKSESSIKIRFFFFIFLAAIPGRMKCEIYAHFTRIQKESLKILLHVFVISYVKISEGAKHSDSFRSQ